MVSEIGLVLTLSFNCFLDPTGLPKWTQNGTKMDPKWAPHLSWGHLGATWGHLGASRSDLGTSWGHLGTILGPFGAILWPLGAILGLLWGTLGAFLGAISSPYWCHLGQLSRQHAREALEAAAGETRTPLPQRASLSKDLHPEFQPAISSLSSVPSIPGCKYCAL